MLVCVAIINKENQPLYIRTYTQGSPVEFHYLVHTSLDIILEKIKPASANSNSNNNNSNSNTGNNPNNPSNTTSGGGGAVLGSGAGAGGYQDLFLGLLQPAEDYKVYGYCTNTGLKLVAVLQYQDSGISVKRFFQSLHSLYINLTFNPFYRPEERIDMLGFDRAVDRLVRGMEDRN
eukprot:Nk52_evm2s238 gene=Nk52_evmTU2s238